MGCLNRPFRRDPLLLAMLVAIGGCGPGVDSSGSDQFVGHATDSTGAGVNQTLAKLKLNAQGNGYQPALSNPNNAVLVGPISFIAPVSLRTAAAACP